MTTYKVIRYSMSGRRRVIRTGLTLADAQRMCSDPETSSKTCSVANEKVRPKINPWFYGYTVDG
jgi:hypothetical protein